MYKRSEKGDWQVKRNCCTSGMCIVCKGSKIRPIPIIHGNNYSEAYARYVASGWQSYAAEAEKMENDNEA